MDSNIQTILIINLVMSVINVIGHFLERIRKSSCCGMNIDLDKNDKKDDDKKDINIDDIIKKINEYKKPDDKTIDKL